jgi:hypothetical protein
VKDRGLREWLERKAREFMAEFDRNELDTAWSFRFYSVERLQCPKCSGAFNHYSGVRPKGGKSEFVIRVRPR